MRNKQQVLCQLVFLLITATAHSQLLFNVHEYRFGSDGKFLSYYTRPENSPAASSSGQTITSSNPVTGQTTVINVPAAGKPKTTAPINKGLINANRVPNNSTINTATIISSSGADSLVMELRHQGGTAQFYDDKQIWIVEYNSTGVFEPYYTIRNKASGKYLTHHLQGPTPSVDLRPLISPDDISQHWALNNLEYRSPFDRLYYGKTREIGFVPGNEEMPSSLQRTVTPRLMQHEQGNFGIDLYGSGVDYIDRVTLRRYRKKGYYFFISPQTKAIPVKLMDIDYPVTPICPSTLVHGDRDYNSIFVSFKATEEHSGYTSEKMNPLTTFEIHLSISNDKREIWANIKLNVKEQKNDRSETEGSWNYKVYTAPAGKLLDQIISVSDFRMSMLGEIDKKSFMNDIRNNCEFLEYSIVVGDTMGDDISDDNNCIDDTRIEKIIFRPLYVTFQ